MAVSKDPTLIGSMFARIVPRYDLMNRLMTFGRDAAWRRLTVDLAGPDAEALALDVGCGTGDLTLALAGRCRAAVGIDFCAEMLQAAQEKARAQGAAIELALADAHHLPFPDDTFGCIVTGFALRNVADIRRVLAEMHRVAVPGGRMACLELTPPGDGPVGRVNALYQRRFVPLLGQMVTGDAAAYAYLPASVASFPQAEVLAEMMRAAGWRQVGYRRLGFGAVAIHYGVK
ncbi:MAG: ubiquinone/menaquinone biosynthesis methyltransferase [Bacteroidetes bacterium]|nr:ubiquinone/menaquinone biosynthesis methyltransferase [Bacteroidota bacterium]MCL5025873.1 ubiquinone/menaquinone biosynthesis methyltransferase [Chloroflexota bacterium]